MMWGSHPPEAPQPWSCNLRVGRLTGDTHVDWVIEPISLGDEVVIKVLESERGTAYLFDGDHLTRFWIKMDEDDWIDFKTDQMKSYADVERFLRRFEQQSSDGSGSRK